MLEQIRIRGLAIIDCVDIAFPRGLSVITGETGAGKSLLLGALRLLLGERAAGDLVGSGRDRARVEGVFRVDEPQIRKWLEEAGLLDETETHRLIIRREVYASGGSRHFVNDTSVTLGKLTELGSRLVALHGQNDQALLLDPSAQLSLLDTFGKVEKELATYRICLAEARNCARHLESLLSQVNELEQRRSFLRYQVDEIDKASLDPHADEHLEENVQRHRNSQRLREAVQHALDVLYEGEQCPRTAAELIGDAETQLRSVTRFDPTLENACTMMNEIQASLSAAVDDLRTYLTELDVNPAELASLEERLDLVRSLKRKYGRTVEDILATRRKLADELEELENYEISLEKAQIEFASALEKLQAAADALTSRRKAVARKFEKLVESQMQQLSLVGTRFTVKLGERGNVNAQQQKADNDSPPFAVNETERNYSAALLPKSFGEFGVDTVEFMVMLNKGDEYRPLRRVASGGELSRIMLAIETVLAEADSLATLVFDEIDSGISGEAAERVGEKLRQLAESHQVICVTHLPQIAACGHHQFVVEKSVRDNSTVVSVHEVEKEARIAALARMLRGNSADEEALRFAKLLLKRFE